MGLYRVIQGLGFWVSGLALGLGFRVLGLIILIAIAIVDEGHSSFPSITNVVLLLRPSI